MTIVPADQNPDSSALAGIAAVRGEAPGLKGTWGQLSLEVAGVPFGVLHVEPSGAVAIVKEAQIKGGQAATLLAVDSAETLAALLRGELNPIVAHLRSRLRVEGDRGLALRVLLGLQAGSPWKPSLRS